MEVQEIPVADEKDDEKDQDVSSADGIEDLEDIDLEDFDDQKNKEEDKQDAKDEGKDKKEDDKKDNPELKALQDRLTQLEVDKRNLNKALHEERQSKKKEKEEPEVLTDDQILGLLKEHASDQKVLLNVIKYTATQIAKGTKKESINEIEISNRKKALDQHIRERIPNYDDDGSPVKQAVEEEKRLLGIEEHPYGDYFAIASQTYKALPDIIRFHYERGKKEALGDKAENVRKEEIKNKAGSPKGGGGSSGEIKGGGKFGITASQMETAAKLGLKSDTQLKMYANQILKVNQKK